METKSNIGKKLSTKLWGLYQTIAPDKLTKQGQSPLDGVYLNGTKAVVTNGHFLIEDSKGGY